MKILKNKVKLEVVQAKLEVIKDGAGFSFAVLYTIKV